MYLSGKIYDLHQRIHQLPTGLNDLNEYYSEASGYNASYDLLLKWDKEFNKRSWIFNFGENCCPLISGQY